MIKHVKITEANFQSTWETIKKRYDNKRALIVAHLNEIFNIPNVNNNSVSDLKTLQNITNDALAALKNLNRPTDQWDDIIVFWTTRRLDVVSLREWEMQLGSSTDYPSYETLNEFLSKRIRTLEAIQLAKNGIMDKTKFNKSQSVKSHAASPNSKCIFCKENHSLFKCNDFRALPTDKIKEFVLQKYACVNCLTPGHKPYDCSSKFSCAKCRRKHNTLLHSENKDRSGN